MNLEKLRKEAIKALKDVKEELNWDMEENYCNMINIMIDYDNQAQDDLYLYDTTRERVEFIDEELLDYLIRDCDNDLGRLRCFIGDTYSANIYKLDGYGNLENVNKEDFEYCIDEAINDLQEVLNENN